MLSQHALQQVSGGSGPRGGACSGWGLLRGCVPALGGGACSGGGRGDPPESRLLLLRTVHILLECILVILLLARSEAANSFI